MKRKFLSGAQLTILITLTFLSGCDKFKNDPGFIGTWQFTEQITADNIVYNTIRTIELTKSTWEETYIIQRQTSPDPSAIIGTRGKLGMSHTSLIFYLEDLGTCVLNESDVCTGVVEWFGEGSVYWNLNIQYFKKAVPAEYEVSGTTLSLRRDLNNDGDYADTGENVNFQMI
jgi:hypothetical protein